MFYKINLNTKPSSNNSADQQKYRKSEEKKISLDIFDRDLSFLRRLEFVRNVQSRHP